MAARGWTWHLVPTLRVLPDPQPGPSSPSWFKTSSDDPISCPHSQPQSGQHAQATRCRLRGSHGGGGGATRSLPGITFLEGSRHGLRPDLSGLGGLDLTPVFRLWSLRVKVLPQEGPVPRQAGLGAPSARVGSGSAPPCGLPNDHPWVLIKVFTPSMTPSMTGTAVPLGLRRA